ncbi:MAG: SpoIIE family protein phosphatase [Caldithrix sp.]|nr:SpoIIE family protein phosphatase [Caldithrix sp.]
MNDRLIKDLQDLIDQYKTYGMVAELYIFYSSDDDDTLKVLKSYNQNVLQTDFNTEQTFVSDEKIDDDIRHQIINQFQLDSLLHSTRSGSFQLFPGVKYGGNWPVEVGHDLLNAINRHILTVVENWAIKEEIDRYKESSSNMIAEMGALHEISRVIDSKENIDSILSYILQRAMDLLKAEAASLMLKIEETNELEFKVVFGPAASQKIKPFRLKVGQGISGWVADHGKPILIPDAYADQRFDPSFDQKTGFKTKSYLCVPMIYKSRIYGVVTLLNRLDGRPFNENDQELLTTFASQAALAIENTQLLQTAIEKERIDKELQVAAEIQRLLIPDQLTNIPDMDIAATYIPCKSVSGDYYDVIKINDNQYVFIVADVAGKGIPGAMLVSNMSAMLKTYLEHSTNLKVIVERLNTRIMLNTTDDRYITFFIALYNVKDKTLTYINAGHNPPLLIDHQQNVTRLKKGGIFIGCLNWTYEQETINIPDNSLLILYTDGLIEAMNSKEEEFGEDKLIGILKDNRTAKSDKIQKKIIKAIYEHVGNTSFEDDFTLILARH